MASSLDRRIRSPLTLVLHALPLARLCALHDGLAEERAHLLDPAKKTRRTKRRTKVRLVVIRPAQIFFLRPIAIRGCSNTRIKTVASSLSVNAGRAA